MAGYHSDQDRRYYSDEDDFNSGDSIYSLDTVQDDFRHTGSIYYDDEEFTDPPSFNDITVVYDDHKEGRPVQNDVYNNRREEGRPVQNNVYYDRRTEGGPVRNASRVENNSPKVFQPGKPGCMFSTMNALLVGVGIALTTLTGLFLSKIGYNIWFILSLSIIGGMAVLLALWGFRRASQGVMKSLLIYIYLTLLFGGLALMFSLSAVFFKDLQVSFFRHRWAEDKMAHFRKEFCEPPEVADTKCVAPLLGGDTFCSEGCPGTEGCRSDDDCVAIRDAAIAETADWMEGQINEIATMGVSLLLLTGGAAVVAAHTLTYTITMEHLVPRLTGVMLLTGAALVYAQYSLGHNYDSDIQLLQALGVICYVVGALLTLCGLLGGCAKAASSMFLLTLYQRALILSMVGLMVVLTGSVVVAVDVDGILNLTDEQLTDFACVVKLHGCTGCDSEEEEDERQEMCPEYSAEEVRLVLANNMQLLALLAFAFAFIQFLCFKGVAVLKEGIWVSRTQYFESY